MVKYLHILILLFSALSTYAQQIPPATNSNNNNMPLNQGNVIETETEPVDTVTVNRDRLSKPRQVKPATVKKERRLQKGATRSIEAMPAEPVEAEEKAEEVPAEDATGGALDLNDRMEVDGTLEDEGAYNQQSADYYNAYSGFTINQTQAKYQSGQRTPLPEHQMQMDEAVAYFETNAPNSFEYHYFKYTAGNYDVTRVAHLRKAEKMMPGNSDVHTQLAAYHIINRDADSATLFIDKLTESGRLQRNTLHYAEDLLLSVPENGVLITHGFDDTYSTWKKQQTDGVRSDVKLVSLDFLQSDFYRKLLREDGFKLPNSTVINVNYLQEFCRLNNTKPISISMTTPKEYFLPMKTNLYVTGLVFEYHEDVYNNFERNNALWNSTLKKHLVNNATDEKSKQLSANYLPMLLQIRKVYRQKEEISKVKDVDKAIDKVSLQCKKYEQVQKLKSSY